jgi:hypothetical protein
MLVLVLEAAAGVLLGLVFYRAVDDFYKHHYVTRSTAALLVLYSAFAAATCLGFAGFLLVSVYLRLIHPENVRNHRPATLWIVVVFLVLGVIFAISYDIIEQIKWRLLKGTTNAS